MNKYLLEVFENLGYKIIFYNAKKNANGQDMVVQKKGQRPLTVEIKNARRKSNGTIEVDPVQENRKKDDLIAINLFDKYVLIEPMKDHLKSCGPKGTRGLTILG